MTSILFLFVTSCAVSLLFTPLVRDVFARWGIVDRPDGDRKLHAGAVPRAGGIPIAVSCAACWGLVALMTLPAGAMVGEGGAFVWAVLPAAAVVFATGLLDDVFGLRPTEKLAGQLAAALLAYSAGVRIAGLAGHFTDDWWSLPLTIAWLVGCANQSFLEMPAA
jgi:UDP-GlcNAc:undecaprenyl-phosphate GlcNAc-1-phosphate transferase